METESILVGGGTFLAAGAFDVLAHLGPTGLVLGGIAALIAVRHGDEIMTGVKKFLPRRENEEDVPQNEGRTLVDRALGRFPQESITESLIALPQVSRGTAPIRDIDIWRTWEFGPQNIYLATGIDDGQDYACSLPGWHHIAKDASTGGGKTLLTRMEIAQQLHLGMDVILCNPHFTPVEKDEKHPDGYIDWRPIAARLEKQGPVEFYPGHVCPRLVRTPKGIATLLKNIALHEIDRRFTARLSWRPGSPLPWNPLYISIDELPWIVSLFPEVAGYVATILQRGRAVDVRLSTSAQSFLVAATGLNSGVRENFGTAYWMGGSTVSGARLLDVGEKDLKKLLIDAHVTPGKGIAVLRNEESVKQATIVRIPLGTNEGTYYLLGKADNYVLPEGRSFQKRETPINDETTSVKRHETPIEADGEESFHASDETAQASIGVSTEGVSDEKRHMIKRMYQEGMPLGKIARCVQLDGGRYTVFQQVCREERLDMKKARGR